MRADATGRFEVPLPPTARYIITVLDPEGRWTHSRQVVVIAAQSNTVDVDIDADVRDTAARRQPS